MIASGFAGGDASGKGMRSNGIARFGWGECTHAEGSNVVMDEGSEMRSVNLNASRAIKQDYPTVLTAK